MGLNSGVRSPGIIFQTEMRCTSISVYISILLRDSDKFI